MQKVGDFSVLPIAYSSQATHYLYIRAHLSKPKPGAADPLPVGRTLFVVNLPPDSTERELTVLFSKLGSVEKVAFAGHDRVQEMLEEELQSSDEDDENVQEDIEMSEEEDEAVTKGRKKQIQKQKVVPKVIPLPTMAMRNIRRTGGIGHIAFTSTKAIEAVLALPKTSLPLVWPKFKASSSAEPSGLAHYISKHKHLRPSLNAIKEHADSSMEVYEYKVTQESKRNSNYKKGEAIVDKDGFTLVTRGGAYGQTLGGGVGVASKKFMEEQKNGIIGGKRNRKKKEQKKEGFYAFQIREKRIQGTYFATIATRY